MPKRKRSEPFDYFYENPKPSRKRRAASRPASTFDLLVAAGIVVVLGLSSGALNSNYTLPMCLGGGILLAAYAVFRFWKLNQAQLDKKSLATAGAALPTAVPGGIGELGDLDENELEYLATNVYQRLGYQDVMRMGGPGDGGIDVWTRSPQGVPLPVQCKQYSKPVTSTPLKEFYRAMRAKNAMRGLFWSPSGYSAPALEYAASHGITCLDGSDILQLVRQAYPPPEN